MKDDENDYTGDRGFVVPGLILTAMVVVLPYADLVPDMVAGYLLGFVGGLWWAPMAYFRGRKSQRTLE